MEAVLSPTAWQRARRHKPDSMSSQFCSGRFQNFGLFSTKCFTDQWRINWKGYERKRIAYNLILWLNICLEWLKNTTKHVGHDHLSANQNMNPEICVLVSRNTPKRVILRLLPLSTKLGQPSDCSNTERKCLREYVGKTVWIWSEEPENWGNCTLKIDKICSFGHISIYINRNRVHMQKLVVAHLHKKLPTFYPSSSLPCLQKPATISYLEPQQIHSTLCHF